jgi:hypothetical protein
MGRRTGVKFSLFPDDEEKGGIDTTRNASGPRNKGGNMFCYKKYLLPALFIAAMVHLASCGSDTISGPGNQANDHISITNDEDAINWRQNNTDVDVPVDDTGVGYASVMGAAARPAAAPFSLKLTAEVLPPVIDNKVLQATSIAMSNNKAVVSYGMRGAE